jgi:hypothetical protein
MNRLAEAAVAATLVALAASAGAGDRWSYSLKDDAAPTDGAAQGGEAVANSQDRTGYGGYADAATAGQAYYGWRYPFAPPLAAALAAADAPQGTKLK